MGNSFEDYLQEFQDGRIEDLNYPFVIAIAEAMCPKYPPEIYSPESIWDKDTMKQLADEFFVEVLLQKDRLKYHYLTQESVIGLKKATTKDFQNFLRNKKLRTEATNMYRRMLDILSKNNQFEIIQDHPKSNVRVCRPSGTNQDVSQTCQKLEEILRVMFSIDLPPIVRYRADSKKESHLISTDDLVKLLTETTKILGKPISVGILFEALKYRLNILEIETLAFEAPISTANGSNLTFLDVTPDYTTEDAEMQLIARESAVNIYERLSDRQRIIFKLWIKDYSLVKIAGQVGVAKSTVHDEICNIQREISNEQPTDDETEIIAQYLSTLCDEFSTNTDGNVKKMKFKPLERYYD
jgi:hypothetical protein